MVFAAGFEFAGDGNFAFGADPGPEDVAAGFDPIVPVVPEIGPGAVVIGFVAAEPATADAFVCAAACEAPAPVCTGWTRTALGGIAP